MRYCPLPSVVAERVFSISAGLLASTLTSGRTAPELSLTVPAIAAWAKTVRGAAIHRHTTRAATGIIARVVRARATRHDSQSTLLETMRNPPSQRGPNGRTSYIRPCVRNDTEACQIWQSNTFMGESILEVRFWLDFSHKTFTNNQYWV